VETSTYGFPTDATPLRGRVIASRVSLPRLDTSGEGCGSPLGTACPRPEMAGEINEPLASGSGTRIVPVGDALPNVDGDFIFEPGRGGGRIDKVNWDGASASSAEDP